MKFLRPSQTARQRQRLRQRQRWQRRRLTQRQRHRPRRRQRWQRQPWQRQRLKQRSRPTAIGGRRPQNGSRAGNGRGVIRGDDRCFRYKCDPIRLVITDAIAAAQPAAGVWSESAECETLRVPPAGVNQKMREVRGGARRGGGRKKEDRTRSQWVDGCVGAWMGKRGREREK